MRACRASRGQRDLDARALIAPGGAQRVVDQLRQRVREWRAPLKRGFTACEGGNLQDVVTRLLPLGSCLRLTPGLSVSKWAAGQPHRYCAVHMPLKHHGIWTTHVWLVHEGWDRSNATLHAGYRLGMLLGAVRHLSSIVLVVAGLQVHKLCQLQCVQLVHTRNGTPAATLQSRALGEGIPW